MYNVRSFQKQILYIGRPYIPYECCQAPHKVDDVPGLVITDADCKGARLTAISEWDALESLLKAGDTTREYHLPLLAHCIFPKPLEHLHCSPCREPGTHVGCSSPEVLCLEAETDTVRSYEWMHERLKQLGHPYESCTSGSAEPLV